MYLVESLMVLAMSPRSAASTAVDREEGPFYAHPALFVSCGSCGAAAGVFCDGTAICASRERQAYHDGYL